MKTLVLSMAALLASASASASTIDSAAKGLKIQVEDDLTFDGDHWLTKVKSKPCVTTLIAKKRSWTLDWRTIHTVGPGDSFLYLEGAGVKMALVVDAGKPAQVKKLQKLLLAMWNEQARCGGVDAEPAPG
jgi:hypothetical protein